MFYLFGILTPYLVYCLQILFLGYNHLNALKALSAALPAVPHHLLPLPVAPHTLAFWIGWGKKSVFIEAFCAARKAAQFHTFTFPCGSRSLLTLSCVALGEGDTSKVKLFLLPSLEHPFSDFVLCSSSVLGLLSWILWFPQRLCHIDELLFFEVGLMENSHFAMMMTPLSTVLV